MSTLPLTLDDVIKVLEPFAAFADPRRPIPASFVITQGSPLAKRQLTMGACYAAADLLTALQSGDYTLAPKAFVEAGYAYRDCVKNPPGDWINKSAAIALLLAAAQLDGGPTMGERPMDEQPDWRWHLDHAVFNAREVPPLLREVTVSVEALDAALSELDAAKERESSYRNEIYATINRAELAEAELTTLRATAERYREVVEAAEAYSALRRAKPDIFKSMVDKQSFWDNVDDLGGLILRAAERLQGDGGGR